MSRSRSLLIAPLVALVAAIGACSADAEATGLPAGVRVAGLDVGGLSVAEAADRIEAAFGRQLRSPVRVRAAGHRRAATARFLRLRFDPLRSAQRAERAARRAADPASVDVPPWVTFSHKRVGTFVRRVARPVARRARNARLRHSVTRVSIRPARAGYDIDRAALRRRIEATLRGPRAPRVLRAARREIEPNIRRRDVLRRNRTIVTVHRRGYRLRVFKRLKQVASYPVAVGMPGHATPRGRFRIANKAVDPAWAAPDKPWAGAYRGEVVAGGAAANPLRARWLGIVDGVGIHGTSATWSLGRRASHGCIRMAVPAVKRVYRLVPVGARVLIK
jgi:lipoprotein-anchoring transpeptidase ErfK/SrfK